MSFFPWREKWKESGGGGVPLLQGVGGLEPLCAYEDVEDSNYANAPKKDQEADGLLVLYNNTNVQICST